MGTPPCLARRAPMRLAALFAACAVPRRSWRPPPCSIWSACCDYDQLHKLMFPGGERSVSALTEITLTEPDGVRANEADNPLRVQHRPILGDGKRVLTIGMPAVESCRALIWKIT